MTSPIHTPNLFDRFKNFLLPTSTELVKEKTQPTITVKPEPEEPSWARSAQDKIKNTSHTYS